jgi:hypothetical protein
LPQSKLSSTTTLFGAPVALIDRQVGRLVVGPVAEHGLLPIDLAPQGLGVGIDQQLGGVKAVALARGVRPVNAKSIERPRLQLRSIAVPGEPGAPRKIEAVYLATGILRVEEADLDAGGRA